MLKRDVEKLVAYVTPFLPFLGLVSGGLTTGKHVLTHWTGLTGGEDGTEGETTQPTRDEKRA